MLSKFIYNYFRLDDYYHLFKKMPPVNHFLIIKKSGKRFKNCYLPKSEPAINCLKSDN